MDAKLLFERPDLTTSRCEVSVHRFREPNSMEYNGTDTGFR